MDKNKEEIPAEDQESESPKTKKEPSKKKKAKDEALVKNTIEINPKLNEQAGKTVVIGWGRMNPITIGHEKLVNKIKSVAKRKKAAPKLFLTHTQDKKKNPLEYKDKVELAKIAFGRNIVVDTKANTIIKVLEELDSSYDNLVLVVGQDRVEDFKKLLNKYNGDLYNFDSIEIVSAGDRDPDAEGVEGMSASKMRALAVAGKAEEFIKGLPKKLQYRGRHVYDMVRAGMKLEKLEEEMQILDEVLDRKARIKRARTMRRYKTKIANARKRVMRRSANKSRLSKRSRRKAVNLVKQRVAGKRGKNYNSLGVAQKMVIDKKVAKRKAVVSRIAKRNLPKVRQADRARRTRREDVQIHPAMLPHKVELPKKKRYHRMCDANGKPILDKRFKAFREKKGPRLEEIDSDLQLLQLIEEIHGDVLTEKKKYMGHDLWGTKKLASITIKKKAYKNALNVLKKIIDRKKKEGSYRHEPEYYAANIARQYDVDPRTLANMLDEAGGAGDEGTDELIARYLKDTPHSRIEEEGRNMERAKELIARLKQDTKERIDDIKDRARLADADEKNRQTESVNIGFKNFLNEDVTQKQLDDLEKFADRLLQKFDIDVEFTRHFADRMNDERNKPAIKISELQKLFKKIAKEKGTKIKKHGDAEAVIKDMQSDLNLPVVVNYKDGEFEVVNKTIMRKKNFKTPDPEVKY